MSFDYADINVTGLVLAIALPHTWMTWKFGGRFMLAMVIAEYSTFPNHLIYVYRESHSVAQLMRSVSHFASACIFIQKVTPSIFSNISSWSSLRADLLQRNMCYWAALPDG